MRFLIKISFFAILAFPVFGQSDLQKLIDAEHAFAQTAATTGTRAAFLANLSDDGIVFLPGKSNGKEYWNAQSESTDLLSWSPHYADISANGILGFTTGNWEYRPKGKEDVPTAFGEYASVWLRQPDGKYKCVVDIGIQHEKPGVFSDQWTTSSNKSKDLNEGNSSAADSASLFFRTLDSKGLAKAYDLIGAEDLRAFREGKMPLLGKKSLVSSIKNEKAKYVLPKRTSFFGSADLAYNLNTYTKAVDGKIVEKGNILQVWKLIGGKWRIVLDVFKPIP